MSTRLRSNGGTVPGDAARDLVACVVLVHVVRIERNQMQLRPLEVEGPKRVGVIEHTALWESYPAVIRTELVT